MGLTFLAATPAQDAHFPFARVFVCVYPTYIFVTCFLLLPQGGDDFATLQHCYFATLQLCKVAKLQYCNIATFQHCNIATLNH